MEEERIPLLRGNILVRRPCCDAMKRGVGLVLATFFLGIGGYGLLFWLVDPKQETSLLTPATSVVVYAIEETPFFFQGVVDHQVCEANNSLLVPHVGWTEIETGIVHEVIYCNVNQSFICCYPSSTTRHQVCQVVTTQVTASGCFPFPVFPSSINTTLIGYWNRTSNVMLNAPVWQTQLAAVSFLLSGCFSLSCLGTGLMCLLYFLFGDRD